MRSQVNKSQHTAPENATQALSESGAGLDALGLEDHRQAAVRQRKLQELANQSPHVRQLQQTGQLLNGTAQRTVIQFVTGDELLGDAAKVAADLEKELVAKKYATAMEHYVALKKAALNLNQRKALSSREDAVFNRHLDATGSLPGVNVLLKTAIARFVEVIQPEFDTIVQEVALFVEQQEKAYEEAYQTLMTSIASGDKAQAILAQKKMATASKDFVKAVTTKGKVLGPLYDYHQQATADPEVEYVVERKKDKEDRTSTIAGSKLLPLNLTTYKQLGSKNKRVKELLAERGLKSTSMAIPKEEEGEIGMELKQQALAELAGSEERRAAIALLLSDHVPSQVKVHSAIKQHHASEAITDVTTYLSAVGLDHLDAALALVASVGAKGTVAQIDAYQRAGKAVTGTPAFAEVVDFLTDLDYPSLASLTTFIAAVGKVGNLTQVRGIWVKAAATQQVDTTVLLLQEGNLPEAHLAAAAQIALAFAQKPGKSTVEDWKALLAVPGWAAQEVIALAEAFDLNPGNAKAAEWVATAQADATLKTKPDEVRATTRLHMFASDDWYDSYDMGHLSSGKGAKKKYTQLLYALLGKKDLDSLKDIDIGAMRGDFLSMLLFFHKHIATFKAETGQGFDREAEGPGTYSRSDKTHPQNVKYKLLLDKLGVDPSVLLQPLNPELLRLQEDTRFHSAAKSGVSYHTGRAGVASAGLPSHNLRNLDQQQLIASKLSNKAETAKLLFDSEGLDKSTELSRTLDDKAAVTDELAKKQKAALAGKVGMDGKYANLHDFLLQDRGAVVSKLSAAVNAITGGAQNLYAISSEGHPSLILLVPPGTGSNVIYGGTTYKDTDALLPEVVKDFNGAPGQDVKITRRGSFGFQRPTVTDTSESIRIWPGYAPVETLTPGLKAIISKLRSKGSSETLGKIDDLDAIKTTATGPILHVEALKAAMRHAMIALEEKVDGGATEEKKRVHEWLKTRLIIKLRQAGILLEKGALIYGEHSTATAQEKNKHYLVTADMTDKLQEYAMLYTASTLGDTTNPNASHTTPGKFKDTNDTYEKRLASKFSGLDYRVFYLDSGEQALVTAGILANRFDKGKDASDTRVAKSDYINRNPYFEISVFGGDKRSNLQSSGTGNIVHADLSPVITSGRTTPKPKAETDQSIKRTWQDEHGTVNKASMIPIIDITNSSLDAITDLGNMPSNFIIVESLTKHQQLGADKFIMGRLIALSNTAGTASTGTLTKTNFLDLAQKVVGPVANAAYNPLLAKVRANMDKALYTEETS